MGDPTPSSIELSILLSDGSRRLIANTPFGGIMAVKQHRSEPTTVTLQMHNEALKTRAVDAVREVLDHLEALPVANAFTPPEED